MRIPIVLAAALILAVRATAAPSPEPPPDLSAAVSEGEAPPPSGLSVAAVAPERVAYRPWRPFRNWFRMGAAAPPATPSAPGGPAATGTGADADPEAAQTAAGSADASPGSQPVNANPAAVNIIAGAGALGRFLGLDPESGLRFGGLWVGDASGVLVGGRAPGHWGLNSLTILDFNLDAEKAMGFKGSSFGTEFL